MKLTENFSLSEFTKSNTALRLGIDNTPTLEHLESLKKLCENILQPLRNELGRSIRISSGYRSKALNEAIGGSNKSQHCNGQAADLELIIDGKEDNKLIFDTIIKLDLPFDQMIWEFGDDLQPDWIHVSHRDLNNRKERLKAVKEGGKTTYKKI